MHHQHLRDFKISLSVCQSVNQSVSQWVCYTKRVERCTDRNHSPICAKLVTKVESREMWLFVAFGGNRKDGCAAKPEVKLIFTVVPLKKSFNVKYLKTVTDSTLGSTEVEYVTTHGLSIGIMNVDLEWRGTVKSIGYRLTPWPLTLDDLQLCWFKVTELSHQVSWMPWQLQCWTPWRSYRKPSMGCWLAPWRLTLDDLELC